MLKSAADGARDAGAEVEYIDLYDLNFTGCRSCMLCKDKIFQADALIIGTPIYLGRPTSRYFALIERLHFCSLSYDDYSNYFKGKVNVGFFVTMNATKELYDRLYKEKFEAYAKEMEMLGGEVNLYPFYDTLQVNDYSKFNMAGFDENKKKLSREKNFPTGLENAYRIGQKLSQSQDN